MTSYVCSGNFLLRQYLLEFGDELMGKFIENPTLQSCGTKTNCRVYLTNRWLNRAIRPGIWKRYFIVNVSGEDQWAINRCNRLIEKCIPEFHKREIYKTKSKVTLYTNEWIPDNSLISQAELRIGGQRSQFGGLTIHSPYTNNITRKACQTPWKITNRERQGHYESGDVYRAIYSKAELGPVDFINPHFPLRIDITKFNLPNSFDRYTTFKSLDNEHLNKKLQQQCCRFIKALKESSDRPSVMNFFMDSRQSVNYQFEEGAAKGGAHTLKLKSTDPRNTSLRVLAAEDLKKAQSQKAGNRVEKTSNVVKELKIEVEKEEEEEEEEGREEKTEHEFLLTSTLDKAIEDEEINHESLNETNIDEIDNEGNQNEENNDNQNNYRLNELKNLSNFHNSNGILCNTRTDRHCQSYKYVKEPTKLLFIPSNIYRKRYRYRCKSRSRRIRYYQLMKQYIKCINYDKSDSRLTYITSPIITETEINSNASKSSNVDDNTLNSLNSL